AGRKGLGVREPREFCSIPGILRQAEADLGSPTSVFRPPTSDLLRSALADSVDHHLIADVPVGLFLSAGLDSSTLTAFAAAKHKKIRTVTLGFEEYSGTPDDEVPLAEAMARAADTQHETVWVARADFESESERLFEAMDRPSTDGVNT